jgi:hypothetical protein
VHENDDADEHQAHYDHHSRLTVGGHDTHKVWCGCASAHSKRKRREGVRKERGTAAHVHLKPFGVLRVEAKNTARRRGTASRAGSAAATTAASTDSLPPVECSYGQIEGSGFDRARKNLIARRGNGRKMAEKANRRRPAPAPRGGAAAEAGRADPTEVPVFYSRMPPPQASN